MDQEEDDNDTNATQMVDVFTQDISTPLDISPTDIVFMRVIFVQLEKLL